MAKCSDCGNRCSCIIQAGANVVISGSGTLRDPYVVEAEGGAGGASGWEAGDMKFTASGLPQAGWVPCNGAALSRTTYAALFAAIGTVWGVGDNSTTFNVPDMRDRFPQGASATKPLGTYGGSASTTLTASHIPQHSHTMTHTHDATHDHSASAGNDTPDHSHAYYREGFTAIDYLAGGGTGALVASGASYAPETFGASARHSHAITVNTRSMNTGASSAANTGNYGTASPTAISTVPPNGAVNYLIKT